MNPIRPAPKAIIIQDGKLLCLKMADEIGWWYMLPGGGVHFGETLIEGLKRECVEEIGADVEVGPLRFVRDYISKHHEFADVDPDAHQVEYMFICRVINVKTLGRGTQPDVGQCGIAWLPLDRLGEFRFYPKALRPRIAQKHVEPGDAYLGDVN